MHLSSVSSLTESLQKSAPGRSGESMRFQIFHTGVTPIPTKVCFPLQVLFSGLLDNMETTSPFRDSLSSHGRSLNKGDKDGLGGSKT